MRDNKPKQESKSVTKAASQSTNNSMEEKLLNSQELKQLLRRDADLLDFSKDFYILLAEANPGKQTHSRSLANRRFGALARILVGDETCVALAFDDDNLVISTNKNQHSSDYFRFRTAVCVKAGSSNEKGYDLQDVHYLSFNDKHPIRKISQKYHVDYDRSTKKLKSEEDKREIKVIIESSEHEIPFVPQIELSTFFNERKETQPLLIREGVLPHDELIETPLKGVTHIDPLKRRADIFIKHLSLIYLVASKDQNKLKEKAKNVIENNRYRFLTQSLSWHAAAIYKQDKNLRSYKENPFKKEIDEFIYILSENFRVFSKNKSILTASILNEWRETCLKKINSAEIKVPGFLAKKPAMFIDKTKNYLLDIINLEAYITEITKNPRSVSEKKILKFLQKENPWEPTSLIKILDDNEKGLHAEMRIIQHFLNEKLPIPYIAISKLCCPYCNLVMKQLGIENISGFHGRIPTSWKLASNFKDNKQFLKNFLGNKLFKKYCALFNKEAINFRKKYFLKSDLALLIIQS